VGVTASLIDLFAGAGGMTLGFTWAGFEPVFAVELDRAAAKTYSANFGTHVFQGAIEEVEDFPEADVAIGGPPCQGFSPLGRDRGDRSRAELNSLWKHYVRAVRHIQPRVFVVENVPQFLGSAQFQEFMRTFRDDDLLAEYQIEARVLNAMDYGVPQSRRRGIIIGSRVGAPKWPEKTHGEDLFRPLPYVPVREAIADLPLEPDGRNLHVGRNPTAKSIERYKAVPEGGNRFDLARNRPDLLPACWSRKTSGTTDVFGRLHWDRPALTIRTEFFKPEKGRYLHPSAHRPITHREAARLQTFPDDFLFMGSKIEIARQIGNAVPPRLAQAIAQKVRDLIY
jgi:DNA (cytosine-5)-methyltransferase 1